MNQQPYIPNNFLIQWHITERCNFRCKHCYQTNFENDGKTTEEMLLVIEKVRQFVAQLSEIKGKKIHTHFNITGGEPFLRKDLLQLLQELHKQHITFGILSNGSFLSDEMLREIKLLNVSFVQLSLEGKQTTNDEIRGKGSFDSIKKGVKKLRKWKIPVIISFTASKANYKEFSAVANIARFWRVHKLWTDRYLPINQKDINVLSPAETKEFFEIVNRERKRKWLNRISGTSISMDRALQFLVAENMPYFCKAGDSLLTIMPQGEILPCRRMPIEIGNIFTDNLFHLYQQHPLLNDLRNPEKTDSNCQKCFFGEFCKGGLKCLSYSLENNPFAKDYACWR